jgi:hypothetical protein
MENVQTSLSEDMLALDSKLNNLRSDLKCFASML